MEDTVSHRSSVHDIRYDDDLDRRRGPSDRCLNIAYRPADKDTVARLVSKYGPLKDLEMWGRALVTQTNEGRIIEHFTDDALARIDLAGLPVFIGHTYTPGVKFPRQMNKIKDEVPGEQSSPIGWVVHSDNEVAPGEVWVHIALDPSGMSDRDVAVLRRQLLSSLHHLSVCYGRPRNDPVDADGKRIPSDTYCRFLEVSLCKVPEYSGADVCIIKASADPMATDATAAAPMEGVTTPAAAAPAAVPAAAAPAAPAQTAAPVATTTQAAPAKSAEQQPVPMAGVTTSQPQGKAEASSSSAEATAQKQYEERLRRLEERLHNKDDMQVTPPPQQQQRPAPAQSPDRALADMLKQMEERVAATERINAELRKQTEERQKEAVERQKEAADLRKQTEQLQKQAEELLGDKRANAYAKLHGTTPEAARDLINGLDGKVIEELMARQQRLMGSASSAAVQQAPPVAAAATQPPPQVEQQQPPRRAVPVPPSKPVAEQPKRGRDEMEAEVATPPPGEDPLTRQLRLTGQHFPKSFLNEPAVAALTEALRHDEKCKNPMLSPLNQQYSVRPFA